MQRYQALGRCTAMHGLHLQCHHQRRPSISSCRVPKRSIRPRTASSKPIASMDAPTIVEQPTTKDSCIEKRVAPEFENDSNGTQRLKYVKGGWNTWRWEGYNVNYVQYGDQGPPLVLVHGFGASAYHYRYNIPVLAQTHKVYAIDLLGFGFSDKPVIDYNTPQRNVWADEIVAFVQQVVLPECDGQKAVLAGNSLGGYNVLSAAAQAPDVIRGIAVLNGAGRFDDTTAATPPATTSINAASNAENKLESATPLGNATLGNEPGSLVRQWLTSAVDSVSSALKRVVLYVTFMQTKQPSRIMSVLKSVYVSPQNLDDALVASIVDPAQHPDAPEVFAKVITGNGKSVNELLRALPEGTPVLLLWGMQDPWIVPAKARQIQSLYPAAELVPLESGHCPHDDTPELVNSALTKWVAALP